MQDQFYKIPKYCALLDLLDLLRLGRLHRTSLKLYLLNFIKSSPRNMITLYTSVTVLIT